MRVSTRYCGLTLVDALVVVLIVGSLAALLGYFALEMRRGRSAALRVGCAGTLKQIYSFAMEYSDPTGTRSFPIAPGPHPRAHDSLNVMIGFDAAGLQPRLFLCFASEALEAEVDEEGHFRLSENTSSYAWTVNPLKNTAMREPLASDKYIDGYRDQHGEHRGHPDGMNVLDTDGSVQWLPAEDLPPEMLPRGLGR